MSLTELLDSIEEYNRLLALADSGQNINPHFLRKRAAFIAGVLKAYGYEVEAFNVD